MDNRAHHLDNGLLVVAVVVRARDALLVEVVALVALMQAVVMAHLKVVAQMQRMESLAAAAVVVVDVMVTPQERVGLESLLLDIKTKY
jgi:hypothetical protein|tara:strand:- start:689 stop:952 length:264 start_codon:yes stop_codon:yes gene_type:complete